MPILDTVKNFIVKQLKVPISNGFTTVVNAFSIINQRKPLEFYQGWVYACTRAIANEVSKIDLKLLKRNQNGEIEAVESHPSMDLLKRPNKLMTKQVLFARLQSDEELFGNEYWFIMKQGRTPVAILPLRPELMEPVPDRFEFIRAYSYRVDGGQITIPIEDIVHFKNYNPATDIVGMSTLSAARDAADVDILARDYNKEFFINGAVPGTILKTPAMLDPESKQKILESFNQKYGTGNRWKTAIAEGGLDIMPLATNQKDMEFVEQRRFSRDEILAIFQVPKLILGSVEDVNRASADGSMFVFAKQTIEPKMRAIVDTLNAFYLPMFEGTEGMFFEFASPVPKDKTALIAEYTAGINGGWLSPNDVRRAEGLPELVDGETTFLPSSLLPFSDPKVKTVSAIKAPEERMSGDLLGYITKSLGSAQKCESHDEPKGKKEPELQLLDDKLERQGAVKAESERTRLRREEKRYANAANELFEEQEKRAIKNLRKALKSWDTKAEEPEILDEDEEIAKTIALFSPLMLSTIKTEGDQAFIFLGIDKTLKLNNPTSKKFVKRHVEKFAKELTDLTLEKLRKTIAEGLAEGEAIPQLTKRIQNSSAFTKARSEMIARTETFRMRSQGEVTAWKESGVVETKIWYTALDERVDPDCAALHGEEVSVGKTFLSLGDKTATGKEVSYEALIGPPLHPRCRCTMLPVTTTNEKSGGTYDLKGLSLDDKLNLFNEISEENIESSG